MFWTYHPHIYAYYTPWKPDVNSNVETITHDFYFFEIFETKFLFFSVTREITEVCYHFITVVSLTNMSHFLIIIIGSKNFLDIAEHFIYFFDPNAWFSLYESQSPSYFICYNTTSPLSIGIDFDQLNSFL